MALMLQETVANAVSSAEHARRSDPIRFARRVLLFFAPIFLVIALVETVLWKTGEIWPMTRVIEKQQARRDVLFMRGILDQGFYRYKFLEIERAHPNVLVLGSSRVMEFRREMFGARSNECFNAGGMIQDLSDLEAYARRLTPTNAPEVVILGLDLWWFNPNKPLINGFDQGIGREAAVEWQEHLRALRRFKSGKVRAPAVSALRARNENIGIEARNASAGFRIDGSMEYNFPEARESGWKFFDREKPSISERIRNHSAQFTPSIGASHERFELLANCLDLFRTNHVLVLGFLPPFSSESAALLQTTPAHSNLWNEVRREMPKIFRERGQPFLDASVPADFGLDDRYMIDGIHAAETFHLHLLMRFLAQAEVRSAFPGLDQSLVATLASRGTNPWRPEYAPRVVGPGGVR